MVMKLFNSRQEILHLFICVVCTQGSFLKPGSYSKNGDVVLGGLFPLHYGAHRTDNYRYVAEAIAFDQVRTL